MISHKKNIFAELPKELPEEIFEKIIECKDLLLERIISDGHSSAPNFWYDDNKNEFVMLLSGSAKILYDDGTSFFLLPGDYFIIPAHQKHRVEETDKNQKTIWFALHYK
ncbi:MAG: lipid A 3-O-deacylase [Ignavibacteria bacterium]|nr:MAG: lipid A 3-O-deacylase [Ignavibacteria bacterium]KAF0161866.1 MAG: lipid A 3-O-deacylase [Ignavibacteria bacterium]